MATIDEAKPSTEKTRFRERLRKCNPTRWPLGVFVSAAIGFVSLIGLCVFCFAWKRLSPGSTDLPATIFDLARSTVTLLGVVTIGGAAAVAYRRQITLETQTGLKEKQAELEEKQALFEHSKEARAGRADLHARYQQCAAQLGHEKTMIRIAGVYALEALAKEWQNLTDGPDAIEVGRAQRDVCIDLLCGYLKSKPEFEPTHDTPTNTDNGEPTTTETPAPVMTAGEADVRLAITTVINRNLQDPKNQEIPGLWSDHDYDFTNAHFAPNTNFSRAIFTSGAKFIEAKFNGDTEFIEAKFNGDTEFRNTKFTGHVIFTEAKFNGGASFSEAAITGDAWFEKVIFTGNATFGGAKFNGGAIFSEAKFIKYALFGGATFTGTALFGEATFTGIAGFNGATFNEHTNFDRAKFNGQKEPLTGARVKVSFFTEFLRDLGALELEQDVTE